MVALLIWISEILGTFGLFYAGALIAAVLLVQGHVALPAGPGTGGGTPPGQLPAGRVPRRDAPAGEAPGSLLVMAVVIAATVFTWAVTTKHALDRGVFNFDCLWYHMPFAVDMVQSHSVDRDASRRDGLHELVLPAELGAAARGRDPADGQGHARAVPELRLAGGGVPGCLLRRSALRARGR